MYVDLVFDTHNPLNSTSQRALWKEGILSGEVTAARSPFVFVGTKPTILALSCFVDTATN